MSTAKSPGQKFFRLLVVAFLCAIPFVMAGAYSIHLANKTDTLPMDRYSGLRWMPEYKDLAFLHRPLLQDPPAETELWRVESTGSNFRKVGTLSADFEWELTPKHGDNWLLLKGVQGESQRFVLSNGAGKIEELKLESDWELMESQGDGLYFQSVDEDLPLDQFVEVEEAPDMVGPQLLEETLPEEPVDEEPELRFDENGEPIVEEPVSPPRRYALKVFEYQREAAEQEPLVSIPYYRAEDKPLIQILRRSPDRRFLALVVKFGEASKPGLWVYDSEAEKLLWTRVLIQGEAYGLDWSSDSVSVAVSDGHGVSLLENALGIESTRLDVSSSGMLKPVWGPGRHLYLVNREAVYSVERERAVAEPIFSSQGHSSDFDDLSLDAMNGRVAFSSAPKGFRELVVRDLKTGQELAKVAYPGSWKQKAQSGLTYQVGNALRYAWMKWSGRG